MIDALLRILERRRRWRKALAYNRVHAFRSCRPGSWMCPSCCAIHRQTTTSKFSGPQFPACCNFPAGGRLGARYATFR